MMVQLQSFENILPDIAFHLVEVADARTNIMLAATCRYWRCMVYSDSKDMTEQHCYFARRYRRRYPGVVYGAEAELLQKSGLSSNCREIIGRRWLAPDCIRPFPPTSTIFPKEQHVSYDLLMRQFHNSRIAMLPLVNASSLLNDYNDRINRIMIENSISEANQSSIEDDHANEVENDAQMALSLLETTTPEEVDSMTSNQSTVPSTHSLSLLSSSESNASNSEANSLVASLKSIKGERCCRPIFVAMGHIGIRDATGVRIYDCINEKQWYLPLPYSTESSLDWGGVIGQRTAQHFSEKDDAHVRVWSLTDNSEYWCDMNTRNHQCQTILSSDVLYTWGSFPLRINCWRLTKPDLYPSASSTSNTGDNNMRQKDSCSNSFFSKSQSIELFVPQHDGNTAFMISEAVPGLSCALVTMDLPEDQIDSTTRDYIQDLAAIEPNIKNSCLTGFIATVCVWDLNDASEETRIICPKRIMLHLRHPEKEPVICNEFSNTALVVWNSYYELEKDGARDIAFIDCYSPSTGEEVWSTCLLNRFINNVITSISLERVVAIGDEELLILNLRDGAILYTLPASYRLSIQFGLDGLLICSNRRDTTVVAIDIYTGQIVWQLKAFDNIFHDDFFPCQMDVSYLLYLPHYKLAREIGFIHGNKSTNGEYDHH
ncbi:hypothetical protein BDF22DRAFT_676441 [Syncephalis plumigaleata]|nr:hypothetical protein BDF22DRAFT_676441 [Syncephalis plumigaleata]